MIDVHVYVHAYACAHLSIYIYIYIYAQPFAEYGFPGFLWKCGWAIFAGLFVMERAWLGRWTIAENSGEVYQLEFIFEKCTAVTFRWFSASLALQGTLFRVGPVRFEPWRTSQI